MDNSDRMGSSWLLPVWLGLAVLVSRGKGRVAGKVLAGEVRYGLLGSGLACIGVAGGDRY